MIKSIDKRGKCIQCGRRTRHQKDGKWLCIYCDVGLEDILNNSEKEILSIVQRTNLSPKELEIVLKQSKQSKIPQKAYTHKISSRYKFGIISDTHIGEKMFDEGLLKYAGERFRAEGVKDVYHVGDILEGMSGRDGQVYDLAQIGFSAQIKYAEEIFKKYFKDLTIYAIQGNHDNWYKIRNNGGIIVGEEMQNRLGKDRFIYLGENEADVKLADGVTMKLFHPNDGTAYATSYKLQKMIESLEAGKKPHILLQGHYHKALYMFSRNVHALECGTLCGQTGWMRGKKIAAHKGFWIIDIEVEKGTINTFKPMFYPAYD